MASFASHCLTQLHLASGRSLPSPFRSCSKAMRSYLAESEHRISVWWYSDSPRQMPPELRKLHRSRKDPNLPECPNFRPTQGPTHRSSLQRCDLSTRIHRQCWRCESEFYYDCLIHSPRQILVIAVVAKPCIPDSAKHILVSETASTEARAVQEKRQRSV